MNFTLYKLECRRSIKILVIFAAILSMYISMIIWMYDPQMAGAIRQFESLMPELMSAVGMTGATDTLESFLSCYLYGMILLVFPMVYTIIRANGLITKYIEQGSMTWLIAAPVKRTTVARTQLAALVSGITVLIAYCTVLEYLVSEALFPGELSLTALLRLNGGLFCLQLFIAGVCFVSACLFDETRLSLAFGAGIPTVMYIMQMLANMGGKLENIRYATFFTLFSPDKLLAAEPSALFGVFILLGAAIPLYAAAVMIFARKNLFL